MIDQTTFAPAPEATSAAPAPASIVAAPNVDPRTPLAVIDFSSAEPDYRGLLGYAVRAAEDRDRRVQFDVVAITPSSDQFTSGQIQATNVMRAIMNDRVPADRLHLGLRTDPALTANQVRVYVR
jgi:hypothetical protein